MYGQRKTKWDTVLFFSCWCEGQTGNGCLQIPDADKTFMSILNLVAYLYIIIYIYMCVCVCVYVRYISQYVESIGCIYDILPPSNKLII